MWKKLELLTSLVVVLFIQSCLNENAYKNEYIGWVSDSIYIGQQQTDVLEIKKSLRKGFEASSEIYNVYTDRNIYSSTCAGYEYAINSSYIFDKKQESLKGAGMSITFNDTQIELDTMKVLFSKELSKLFFIDNNTVIEYTDEGFKDIRLDWKME